MALSLLNITRLSHEQLRQLVQITTNPQIMQHIGDGTPYTLATLRDFIKDEHTQLKQHFHKRKYWTFAIILDGHTPIGMFALYKLNFAKYITYFTTTPRSRRTTRLSKRTTRHMVTGGGTRRGICEKHDLKKTDIYIGTRILLDIGVQGRGYGVQVYELMKTMMRAEGRGRVHMISFVNSDNINGNKLQKKNGFTLLGEYKDGAVSRNVYYWTLLK